MFYIKFFILLLFLTFSFSQPSYSGEKTLSNKEYAKELLKHGEEHYFLGTQQGYLNAIPYLEKSSQLGNSMASYRLSLIYSYAPNFPNNKAKGLHWAIKSGQQGYSLGYAEAANLYLENNENNINSHYVIYFLELSAKNGNDSAATELGKIYFYGKITKQDYVKSKFWLQQAVDNQNYSASNPKKYLGQLYKYGLGVPQDYKIAKNLFENGSLNYDLGMLYFDGLGVPQDYKIARDLFYEASKRKDDDFEESQYMLGLIYANGLGIQQDFFQAKIFFESANKRNHAQSQYNLGIFYMNGYGTKQDTNKAKEFFGKSCDNKYQKGCFEYSKLNK